MRRVLICAATLSILSTVGSADTLLLKDGRIVDGRRLERTAAGVKVVYENGEVLVPLALVEDALIEGAETTYVPATEEEKAKAAQGLLPFEGKWVPAKRRAELIAKKIAEKQAALEEIKAHSEWRDRWMEKTAHFEFEYIVPPHVFGYYRDMMEAYFTEFGKVWGVKQPKEFGRLKVCFYTDLDKFQQIGGVGGGVRGYFKFVAPLELNFYYDRLDPRYTEEVMFHETNHYLQLLIDPKFSMPHFPGESIAEYYGASVYDPVKKSLTVGLIQEGRLTEVKAEADADQMLALKKMLEADEMYEHYSWGWTLVHYLMSREDYRKKFEKWVLALPKAKDIARESTGDMSTVRGPEVLRSFMKYMGIKDEAGLAALEKEWHAYVKDELDVSTGRGLAKAAQGAVSTGRPIKAKRLYKEAIDKGDTTPTTFMEYGRLLARDSDWDGAIAAYRKAVELDPLTGQFHLALAEALKEKKEVEDSKRLARLAAELEPDDMWLQFRVKELLK